MTSSLSGSIRFLLLFFCLCLQQNAARAITDSLALKRLIEQADSIAETAPAEAHRRFGEAQKQATGEALKLYRAQALFAESFLFFQEANYPEAIQNCMQAVSVFESLGKKTAVAKCYNQMGICRQYFNDYAQSLRDLFHALQIAEDIPDLPLAGKIYTNIGLAYETLEDWENTLAYARKSLHIKQQLKDTAGLAKVYHNLGNAYYYQKKDSLAVVYFRLSEEKYILLQDSLNRATTAHDLGNLFAEQGRYDSARQYLQTAFAYLKNHRETAFFSYCLALTGLANVCLQQGDIREAKDFLNACKPCEAEINDFAYRKSLYKVRYEFYKKSGNTAAALQSLEQMQEAADSLFQQSKNFENQRIAIRYEFDRRASQDSLRHQLQLTEEQRTTAQYRGRMYLLLATALLIAVIAGFFYFRSAINRKKQLIARQQAQLAESKALRAQMNPHFIFNCLNTMDAFVLQNKQHDASQLIQRFSKLSRSVLEHTSQNYIHLKQELETLRIYLEIEQTRKTGLFQFQIAADDDVLHYLIPPMLLQPFVENAVLHGMKGMAPGKGCIGIRAAKQAGYIRIEIEDNGMGRKRAQELRQAQPSTHQSLSMEITLQRLALLHGHPRSEDYICFTDRQAPEQGTHVQILIPLRSNDKAESDYTG